MNNIETYIKEILKQINSGLSGSGYLICGDIKIEYKDGDNIISLVVSNKG